jgi:putative transposase
VIRGQTCKAAWIFSFAPEIAIRPSHNYLNWCLWAWRKTRKRDSFEVEKGQLDVVLWAEAKEGGMPGKRHSEEQIVYALRQVEGGKKVSEVCREMGVSQQAFYSWRRRYAGLGLQELRELRQLREENRKLKGIVADLTLDKHILQEVLSKKAWSPPSVGSWCAKYAKHISSVKTALAG